MNHKSQQFIMFLKLQITFIDPPDSVVVFWKHFNLKYHTHKKIQFSVIYDFGLSNKLSYRYIISHIWNSTTEPSYNNNMCVPGNILGHPALVLSIALCNQISLWIWVSICKLDLIIISYKLTTNMNSYFLINYKTL